MKNFPNVTVVDHPFVIDSLAHLRDEKTDIRRFRYHSDQICHFLFAQAIEGLTFKTVEIQTPIMQTQVQKLADDVIILPILRAGLAMLFGAIHLLPKSKVGFAGIKRNEDTALPMEYYWNMPEFKENSVLIVTDPMLATGGTIKHIIDKIDKSKCKEVRVVSVVSAPEGIKTIRDAYPDIKIFTAAIDEKLNSKAYIQPGLGDYGDRYFGT